MTVHPLALTKPGEMWHLNCYNLSEVIVVRDGPDAMCRTYVDGRHKLSIGKFHTMRDAAEAMQSHNAMNRIKAFAAACDPSRMGDLLDFAQDVLGVLKDNGQ